MARRPRSKSTLLGAVVGILGVLAILAASFGLKAIGDNRIENDTARGASGGNYSTTTTVAFAVRNSLPAGVIVTADVSDPSGWKTPSPTDADAFADRKIASGATLGADLSFLTMRSRVPFTLTFATDDGTKIGSAAIDRDYLRETCTEVTQGKYTVKDCTQVNVWWLADTSVFTATRILGKSSSCPSTNNSMVVGTYVDKSEKTQQVKLTLTCSSTTGATTATLTQSVVDTATK